MIISVEEEEDTMESGFGFDGVEWETSIFRPS